MPLKKWGDLSKSSAYKSLTPEKQESARVGYFDQNIAPNVSPERLPGLRKEWDDNTGRPARPARQATPAPGVAKPNANLTTPEAMARPTTAKQAAPQQSRPTRPGAEPGKAVLLLQRRPPCLRNLLHGGWRCGAAGQWLDTA